MDGRQVVDFGLLDERTGWVEVARNGALGPYYLLFTGDGGATWSEPRAVPLGVTSSWSRVTFVDASHGWLATPIAGPGHTTNASVSRTIDGGRTWQTSTAQIGAPSASSAIAVHFRNRTDGELLYRADDPQHIAQVEYENCRRLSTTDGGATWSGPVVTQGWCPMEPEFVDPLLGLAPTEGGGRTVLTTTDGGRTWIRGEVPTPDGLAGYLPKPRLIERSGAGLRMLVDWIGAPDYLGVATSADGGRTWTIGRTSAPLSARFASPSLIAEGQWAIVALVGSRGPVEVRVTKDAGATWTARRGVGLPAMIRDLHFLGADHGWAIGGDAVCAAAPCTDRLHLYATTDGGDTWKVETSLDLP